jgi:hypothetical protein
MDEQLILMLNVMRNMASRYHRQEWVMNDDSYDIDKVS